MATPNPSSAHFDTAIDSDRFTSLAPAPTPIKADEGSSVGDEPQEYSSKSSGASQKPSMDRNLASVEKEKTPRAAELRHSNRGLLVIILFSLLVIASWTMTCILSFRPMVAPSYSNLNYWLHNTDATSLRWYRAVDVLEAIVSLLTIPVTSTICIKGALTFIQSQKHRVSVRKALLLADRTWTNIPLLLEILRSDSARESITPFFIYAFMLNIIGFLLAPLKQVLVNKRAIKTPSFGSFSSIESIADLTDLFHYVTPVSAEQLVGSVREILASTTPLTKATHLWAGSSDHYPNGYGPLSGKAGVPFGLIYYLKNPFVSIIPAFFNTGFFTQYAPRINSSVGYQIISPSSFATACVGSTKFQKEFTSSNGHDSLQICMPGNDLLRPPWQFTNDRQDISETLLMRTITVGGDDRAAMLTVKTTAGYFELPNHNRGDSPGPLLDKGPHLGNAIERHFTGQYAPPLYNPPTKTPNESAESLEEVTSKGPLLLVTLAAFGKGSFLSRRWGQEVESSLMRTFKTNSSEYSCSDLPPFGFLSYWPVGQGCKEQHQLHYWIKKFRDKKEVVDTMILSLFLASEAWLAGEFVPTSSLKVQTDLGANTVIPDLSLGSIVALSVIIAIFLLGLLAMAIYSHRGVHWTSSLDSFAMMRLGAAAADKLPFHTAVPAHELLDLDEIPCWVGDAEPEKDVGKFCIGAEAPLTMRRRYTTTTE